jgi:CDP-glucose 4,6-dehydratase
MNEDGMFKDKDAVTGGLPKAEFWQGKRVLVTGHTGFKGGWMCLWLRLLGADVFGFALPASGQPSLFAGCFSHDDPLGRDIGDLRDPTSIDAQLQRVRPEIVVHMAAQALVRRSIADPIETFATNVMGTAYLLSAVQRQPTVRAVVNVTSDKCYQNNEWVWPYRETDPLGGKDPYSSSKACAELVGEAFRRTYFHGKDGPFAASCRAGNVVGGGDWGEDRLVPDCIRAFEHGAPVVVRSPASVRPWQHVLEPLAGYLLVAQQLYEGGQNFAGPWNFGPDSGNTVRVGEVVNLAAERWGQNARAIMAPISSTGEAILLRLDSSKARALLGWRPRLGLKATIDWTVEWYQRCTSGEAAHTLCIEQIRKYEAS